MPDGLYSDLMETAAAHGMTPLDWIAAQVGKTKSKPRKNAGKTLADLFVGRVGRIRSGGKECLSEDAGKKFAADLEARRKSGHL